MKLDLSTKEKIALVRHLAEQGNTQTQIAKKLNISLSYVHDIVKNNQIMIINGNHPQWTDAEIDILRKYYPIEGENVVLRLQNRTYLSVLKYASKLKIRKPNMYQKKVLCVELHKVYDSITSAAKASNSDRSSIGRCCAGKVGFKTAGGYHWKFVD